MRECDDVAAVREVLAQASAVVAYLEGKGDGQAIAAAGEVRIVAERRLGELLAATVTKTPGNRRGTGDTVSPVLADLGLSKKQSSRAQQLAAIPEETFEAYVSESKAAGKAPSKNGLLKRARRREARTGADAPKSVEADPAVHGSTRKKNERLVATMVDNMSAWQMLLQNTIRITPPGVHVDASVEKDLRREAAALVAAARDFIKHLDERRRSRRAAWIVVCGETEEVP